MAARSASPHRTPVILLTLQEMMRLTSMSRSMIYELMGVSKFPKPVRVGARAVRWIADEVKTWIATRPRAGSDRPQR